MWCSEISLIKLIYPLKICFSMIISIHWRRIGKHTSPLTTIQAELRASVFLAVDGTKVGLIHRKTYKK